MKRFIAGANCPGCGHLDSLRIWKSIDFQYMDCIYCDFQQKLELYIPNKNSKKTIKIITVGDN